MRNNSDDCKTLGKSKDERIGEAQMRSASGEGRPEPFTKNSSKGKRNYFIILSLNLGDKKLDY